MKTDKNITRRKALKMMGAFMASSSISSLGLASLSSCTPRDKTPKRLVFYFTATGNSLYVARVLSLEPISIPQTLKNGKLDFEADEIGFIFPDFAASAPLMVREFIEKASFKAPYIFSIITYGNYAANVCDWWNDFCKRHNVTNDYINTLLMVDNYLPVFDMNEQMKMDKKIPENLTTIVRDIDARRQYISHVEIDEQMQDLINHLQADHFPMQAERLLALNDAACVGCGICSTVCPHDNFTIGRNASFKGSCEYCLACVHACPQKALTLARGERNPQARFRNENVSLADLRRANGRKG